MSWTFDEHRLCFFEYFDCFGFDKEDAMMEPGEKFSFAHLLCKSWSVSSWEGDSACDTPERLGHCGRMKDASLCGLV